MNHSAPIIDTHCHIAFKDYDTDRAAVLQRAWDAGLAAIVMIGAGSESEGNRKSWELAQTDPRLFTTLGIHPHDADKLTPAIISDFEHMAQNSKVVAIGEIGLDYHYDHAPKAVQHAAFRQQLELAVQLKLPVTIHSRDADADTYTILQDYAPRLPGGIMHCFGGDVAFAHKIFDLGFLISIPGIVTFKKAETLQAVVRECPLEKMLIETDAPYLAPIPYRGKRNEPAYVAEVAKAIAQIKGISYAEVAQQTTQNAISLLRLTCAGV